MPLNKKRGFVCPRLKKPKIISIGHCLRCPFVAAIVEEKREIINITCGFPGQKGKRPGARRMQVSPALNVVQGKDGERIERPRNHVGFMARPRVNKIDRDGVI